MALLIMAAGFAVMNAGQLRSRRAVVMAAPSPSLPAAPRMPAALADPETVLLPQVEERALTTSQPSGSPSSVWLIAAGGVAAVTAFVWMFTRRR